MPMIEGTFLVVRSSDPRAVAESLGLTDLEDHTSGFPDRSVQRRRGVTWVSQPIRGFVLVTGALPHCALDLSAQDPALAEVRRLSREFGEAFVFGEDNGCPYCHYAWCRDGEIVRAYAMVTDPECVVMWNVGEATEAERAFSVPLKYLDSHHEGVVPHLEYSRWLPFEETSLDLAAAWCVSPTSLTDREDLQCYGLSGSIKPSWPVPWNSPVFGGKAGEDGDGEMEEGGEFGLADLDGSGSSTTVSFSVMTGGLGSVNFPVPTGEDAQAKGQEILRVLESLGVNEKSLQEFERLLRSGRGDGPPSSQ